MGVTIIAAAGSSGAANDASYCDATSGPTEVRMYRCNYVHGRRNILFWSPFLVTRILFVTFLLFSQAPGKGYFPSFPATSPYVTAVGATMGPESGMSEIACQAQLGGVITTGTRFHFLFFIMF